MVGVQWTNSTEGPDQALVGAELRLAHLEEHGEEVRGVPEVVVRVDVRLALRVRKAQAPSVGIFAMSRTICMCRLSASEMLRDSG